MTWYKIHKQQVEFHIIAKPNAKITAIQGINEQGLQVSLHAKPHQGEANKALIACLAAFLNIPKSKICLSRGETNRYKSVMVPLTAAVQELIDDPNGYIENSKWVKKNKK